ncbi:Protein CBG13655 [Caenorhabditis briggsae]|uniref:Uncharacterized protein n=2 Tax=Caenorhabditis briggsae TaxID=6238 RepID=A0AAE9A4Y8_CAEBR|nr:Protein CBG13655 [Caenorhabditis briggsae]ULT93140.1 hypothetical protein L3Y34_002966 [Caenorhabditis briggsae]UMM26394.1 hypothetical protein L5515_010120 [Caenorhabditis briggsae]CAP32422.2 Protein CBG13655 [Caenorhabditis briggsae]
MDTATAKATIANVVTSIKDCADVGMFVFSKMHPAAAALVGVGLLVKNLIISTDSNPVLDDLKGLRSELNNLGDKMGTHFSDLKAFMVAQTFYKSIAVKAAVLSRAMADTNDPDSNETRNSSVAFFKKMYEKNTPLELAYTLKEMLDNKVTNPLKMAMDADELMTEKTFNEWKSLIDGVFAQLWTIECFASGLIYNENTYRQNRLAQELMSFRSSADNWEKEYKAQALFWPQKVRRFVETIQDKTDWKSHNDEAVAIKEGLEKILTDDMFYIVIFPESSSLLKYQKSNDQLIESLKRGGTNILIYRSKTARTVTQEKWDKLKQDVENQRAIKYADGRRGLWMDTEQVKEIAEKQISNCVFLLVVGETSNVVAVQSTHADIWSWGPGWWNWGNYTYSELEKIKGPYLILSAFE